MALSEGMMMDIDADGGWPNASLPRVTDATTPSAIRDAIAAALGIPVGDVRLKHYGLRLTSGSRMGAGVSGNLFQGTGLLTYRDRTGTNNSIRLRVCQFTPGGQTTVVSVVNNVPEDKTILVQLMLGGDKVVLALHERLLASSEFEENGIALQQAFIANCEAIAQEPLFEVVPAFAPAGCEPH